MNLFSNIFSVSSARKEHERNNMYIIYRLPIIPLHCEDAPSPLTFPKCTIDPRLSWSLASSACRIFNKCSSGELSFFVLRQFILCFSLSTVFKTSRVQTDVLEGFVNIVNGAERVRRGQEARNREWDTSTTTIFIILNENKRIFRGKREFSYNKIFLKTLL